MGEGGEKTDEMIMTDKRRIVCVREYVRYDV